MSAATRRDVLRYSAAAAGLAAQAWLAPGLRAAEQPFRPRLAMCNETFEGWSQPRIFRFLAQCGYQGVEIAPYTIHDDVTQITSQQRQALRTSAAEAGIEIVALHWLLSRTEGLHLTHPDSQVRSRTAAYLGELARFCRDLGGHVIVFGSPKQRNLLPGVTRGDGMRYAADVLRAVTPVLKDADVVLALEPLSPGATNFLTTAAEAMELAALVDSPHCRLLLDCLAMNSESTPAPDLIRQHAGHLVHFHANDPNRRGPGMGKLDFLPIFQALREGQFGGWISVEVFDYSPGAETIARESIAYMKNILARMDS